MISAYPVTIAGTPPTFATPATTETVEIGTTLIVKNASASSINVTLVTAGTLPTGDAYPDKVYAVPAGQERWIPVLADYVSASNSRLADVTFSAVTSVTAAALVR